MAWYATALALKFRMPVETVLILLVEKNAPVNVPDFCRIELGSFSLAASFRVARMWEIDPQIVFQANRISLLPWVTLMACPGQELDQAAARVAASRNPRTTAEFMLLGGLRYDKNDLASMLGRMGSMLLSQEIIEQSWFYQEILEKGMKDGIQKGIEKGIVQGIERGIEQGVIAGRLEELRRVLRRVVSMRFSELGNLPELDAVKDPDRLESLHDRLIVANNPEQALAAIQELILRL
jgi:hypothetical protein